MATATLYKHRKSSIIAPFLARLRPLSRIKRGDYVSKRKNKRKCATTNRHHLIFQRKHYRDGYAKLLREAFVYELDIDLHNELHNTILHDVPRPSGAEIKAAWLKYERERDIIAKYDIIDACEWLMQACDDPAWRACMQRQLIFLRSRLGGY